MTRNVGYRKSEAHGLAGEGSVPFNLMYPTETSAATVMLGPYEVEVAQGAPIARSAFPLVIVSHGTRSSGLVFRSLAMFLARNGCVVALPEHPGDNLFDYHLQYSYENLEARPQHIRMVIDAVLADQEIGPSVQPDRVAVIGHSVGGYTALAVGGAAPHTGFMVEFAQREQHVPWTALVRQNEVPVRAVATQRDRRVRVLVALAPDFSLFMHNGALDELQVPVLLMVAEHDDWSREIIAAARQAVPDPALLDARLVPNAGHYSFTSEFPPSMRARVGEAALDPPGFDRGAFQHSLQDDVLAFLRLHDVQERVDG